MQCPQLQYKHLREGNITLLAKLTGFQSGQLSMWFNTNRQPSCQSVKRLSQAIGISETEVIRAIDDRRAEVVETREINKVIRQAIAERRAQTKRAAVHI